MGLLQSILDFVIGLFFLAIGFYLLKIFNGIAFALWAYTAPPPSSVVSVFNGIAFALWAYTAPPPSSVVSVTNGISTLGPWLGIALILVGVFIIIMEIVRAIRGEES